jgi:hypothetical protein
VHRLPARTFYLAVGAVVLVSGTIENLSTVYDMQRGGRVFPLWQPIVWSVTSLVTVLALLPLVVRTARWIRTLWPQPMTAASAALAGMVLYSALHIVGMVLLRDVAYAAYGETYTFPWTLGQVFYELRKDAIGYVLLVACVFLNEWPVKERSSGAVEPVPGAQLEAMEPPSGDLWLRDGAASRKVSAADIAWVGSAGNYVEYALAGGKRHLIRGTLSAEETRLEPLGIVRIHRTRLVNVKRAVSVTPRASGDVDVRLDTGEVVICSRRYRDRLRSGMGI